MDSQETSNFANLLNQNSACDSDFNNSEHDGDKNGDYRGGGGCYDIDSAGTTAASSLNLSNVGSRYVQMEDENLEMYESLSNGQCF